LPSDTRSVSVFLVNNRPPKEERGYRAFAFQTCLSLNAPRPFVPRLDLRGTLAGGLTEEWDEQVPDLQFRDVFEYAVGYGVSSTGVMFTKPRRCGTSNQSCSVRCFMWFVCHIR
jgi:hypothetical protein